LSKRTLQRRIEAEGTSYQQILKETREALARHNLEKTALPVAEISFLLAFEPNSFYRAFRAWTGMTPESVRHARKEQ
jgi:AraC-like DNA-binding protein